MTDIHWYVFCHQKDLKNHEILEHPEFERTHKGHQSPAKRRWLYWRSTLYSSQGGTWERSPMWGGGGLLTKPTSKAAAQEPTCVAVKEFWIGMAIGKGKHSQLLKELHFTPFSSIQPCQGTAVSCGSLMEGGQARQAFVHGPAQQTSPSDTACAPSLCSLFASLGPRSNLRSKVVLCMRRHSGSRAKVARALSVFSARVVKPRSEGKAPEIMVEVLYENSGHPSSSPQSHPGPVTLHPCLGGEYSTLGLDGVWKYIC